MFVNRHIQNWVKLNNISIPLKVLLVQDAMYRRERRASIVASRIHKFRCDKRKEDLNRRHGIETQCLWQVIFQASSSSPTASMKEARR